MAIAFDASADGGLVNTGTSLTWAHTCSGSDRVLYVAARGRLVGSGADVITGVTYNGVSLTQIGASFAGADGRWSSLWSLDAPASGTNNVVISSANDVIIGASASYTGATTPTTTSQTTLNAGPSTFPQSLTIAAANSWMVCLVSNDFGNVTAGTSTTLRVSNASGVAILDSGTALGTGSATLNAVSGGAPGWGGIASELPDAGGGGGTTWPGYQAPFGWN